MVSYPHGDNIRNIIGGNNIYKTAYSVVDTVVEKRAILVKNMAIMSA